MYGTLLLHLFGLKGEAQQRAPHSMFLEYTLPQNGSAAVFNPAILRWPRQKGNGVLYEVMLSQDSTFSEQRTLHGKGLVGAVFNAHKQLPSGTWFWRHRVAEGKWSDRHHFFIDGNAIAMASPSVADFLSRIPAGHPRILLDPGQTSFHRYAQRADAKAILAEAENAIRSAVLKESDAHAKVKSGNELQQKKLDQDAVVAMGNHLNEKISSLCQSSLIKKDNRYFKKALEQVLEVAIWDHKGITGSSDFADAKCMYAMALFYDTFYGLISETQRKIIVDAIALRAEGFYKEWLNNIESKVLSGHVWQLILNDFFKTSLALVGHHPRAENWLSYAYELFLSRAPILGGTDGGWAEGTYYFTMNMQTLVEIPEKIRAYTGFDFINTHPWYKNQAAWLIYNVPAGSSTNGFGDNSEELFVPPLSYAAFAEVMAGLTKHPQYSWYLHSLKKSRPINLSVEPTLRWFRFAHADDPGNTAVLDPLAFPMAHLAKEVGLVSMHTHPEDASKDVMVAFRSSPFGAYGHILADQNTFNILAGGKRLFYRTGYKVAMNDPHRLGWSKHTKSQNGVLINGNGQPYTADAFGNMVDFFQNEEMAYAKGDASHAYKSAESKEDHGLLKFYRHMALLQPGIVVIYDELEAQKDADWSWLIHSIENMKIDTLRNEFISDVEGFRGTGRLWSDKPFRWECTNKFEVPVQQFRSYKGMMEKRPTDDQWHLKANSKNKTKKVRFFAVIQVGAKDQPFRLLQLSAETGVVRVNINDWVIAANLDSALLPQLSMTSPSGKTIVK